MSEKLSFHLDILRAAAAICVLLHHYNGHIFSGGFRLFPNIGQEAVMVFFVVSGFVIMWVGTERENNLSEFVVRRLARLWSVLFPAIVIILLCFCLAKLIFREAVFPDANGHDLLQKTIAAIAFLNWNSFTGGYYLPAGGVMWSLSCEFWYYAIFAVWLFLPNRWPKWLVMAFIIVFLGFKPMLLFPIWIMGAYAYKLVRSQQMKCQRPFIVMSISMAMVALLQMSGLRYSLLCFPQRFHNGLGHSFYAPYYWVLGGLIFCYILAVASLPKQETEPPGWIARPIRLVAGTSFFLYLTHMPIMALLAVLLPPLEPFPFFIPLVTLVFALIVGRPVENSKHSYVQSLRKLFKTRGLVWLAGYSARPA